MWLCCIIGQAADLMLLGFFQSHSARNSTGTMYLPPRMFPFSGRNNAECFTELLASMNSYSSGAYKYLCLGSDGCWEVGRLGLVRLVSDTAY